MASTAAAHPVTTDNRVLLLFLETLRIHALVTFPIHLHVDFYQRNPGERFNVKFSIHFDAPQAVPWLRMCALHAVLFFSCVMFWGRDLLDRKPNCNKKWTDF